MPKNGAQRVILYAGQMQQHLYIPKSLCQMHCLNFRNVLPKPLWLQLLVDCVYHPTMDLGIAVAELENDGCRWHFEDGGSAAFLKVQVLPA